MKTYLLVILGIALAYRVIRLVWCVLIIAYCFYTGTRTYIQEDEKEIALRVYLFSLPKHLIVLVNQILLINFIS